MAERKKFSGSIVALVTPFERDATVDWKRLRELVDFQLSEGTDGIVPCGTTGESPSLNHEEQLEIIKAVIQQVKRRVPVIAGAGSNSTKTAISLAKAAEEAGADAILSVGPYYNKPTQEGFYQHFQAVASAVKLPMILYNVPGRTGSNIETATTLRLARTSNIVGIKEASGNMTQIMEILRSKPADFAVLSGDDAITLPLMVLGCDGVISVAANEAPRLMKEMVGAARRGDFEQARRLHNTLLPLMNVNFIESSPIPVKTALAMMGRIEENFRLPLCSMKEDNRIKLRKVLEELRLL